MIRTLIIDDEPLARALISTYLKEHAEFELIGEFGDGLSALKAINELKPDLVFLDIQMPKLTGIELVELLDTKPMIVFITAYNQYAIEAFELSACDYLLKPFTRERFHTAIDKIQTKAKTENGTSNELKIDKLIKDYAPKEEQLERIAVKLGSKIEIFAVSEITHLQAEGDYVMIFTGNGKYLKDRTMKYFESRLDENKFVRIHRSIIVNIDEIQRIELFEKESYIVILKGGATLKTSGTGYRLLKEKLHL